MRRLLVVVLLLTVTAAFAQSGQKLPINRTGKHARTKSAPSVMVGEITVKTIAPMTAATVMERAADFLPPEGYKPGMEGAQQAWKAMLTDAYTKLGEWIKKGGQVTGPSFATYYEDPNKTSVKELTCRVGYPTNKGANGGEFVTIVDIPATQAAVAQFSGSYEGSSAIYGSLTKWISDHGYTIIGPPTEVYLSSEHDGLTPSKYLTEIQFPVFKGDLPKLDIGTPKEGETPKTIETSTSPGDKK